MAELRPFQAPRRTYAATLIQRKRELNDIITSAITRATTAIRIRFLKEACDLEILVGFAARGSSGAVGAW
jgi:hypothetical protein